MKKQYLTYLIILILSFLEWRLLMMLHLEHLVNDAIATVSPVYGKAWWRAFQNRLLAGTIINNLGFPLPDAFGVFICSMVLGAILMLIFLYRAGAGQVERQKKRMGKKHKAEIGYCSTRETYPKG